MLKKYILKVIIITIICELTIFNINSYRTAFSKYEQKEYFIDELKLKNLSYNKEKSSFVMKEENAYLIIDDLNCKVGTVYINASAEDKNAIEYSVMYSDETTKNYREMPSKYLVNSIERSKYITCFLSGKSEKIAIKLHADKGTSIKLDSIKINSKVPFSFNLVRVLTIILIFILLYCLKHIKLFNKTFEEDKQNAVKIIFSTINFFIILIVIIGINTIGKNDDIYCKDFAESISKGKFYLEKEPNKELLELENPYDNTLRNRERDGWDIALFDGKFYVYFGILPELVLFVPYLIIFGKFLPSGVGVLIFSIFATMGLGTLLLEILEKWFSKIPVKIFFYCEVILLSGSVIFNLVGRPEFYEIAVSSALCFTIYGILFSFRFFVQEEKKYVNLLMGSTFLALSVACRPIALLVSLIILPLIIMKFIKDIREKNNIIKLIASVAIPYLTIGILLMIYNYIRFKNPLEFGAHYQLTVNDMRNLKYRFMTIPVGLYTAFLKIPHFISKFPFIKTDGETINFFGYFYTEDNIGGLFILVPTTMAILLAHKVQFKNKKIEYLVKSFTIVGLIICIISIVEAGVLQRYLTDYAWLLIISSLIILLTIYEEFKSAESRKIFVKLLGFCAAFVFLVNLFSGGIVGEKNLMQENSPDTYYNLRYTICFWE